MKILLVELIILIALYTDLKYHKIPNILTFSGMLAGILVNINGNLTDSLLGLTLVLVGYIPVYIMGAVAAGDVKLLMAVGLIMGYKFIFAAVIFIVICNLAGTAVILARKKRLFEVLGQTYNEIRYRLLMLISNRKKDMLDKPGIEARTVLPYMPAVFCGINMAVVLSIIAAG